MHSLPPGYYVPCSILAPEPYPTSADWKDSVADPSFTYDSYGQDEVIEDDNEDKGKREYIKIDSDDDEDEDEGSSSDDLESIPSWPGPPLSW